MGANKNIQDKIDKTFKAIGAIETINVSPYFKEKTMKRLFFIEEKKTQVAWAWFTPKLQFATLVCVVVLNVIAFTKLQETSYEENVSEFAENYGLSTRTKTSILN